MSGGVMNNEQEKFWSKLIVDELPIKGLVKWAANIGVPVIIGKIDDKYLENIPSPWKQYAMQLQTSLYLALADGSLNEQELEEVVNLCVSILNEHIHIIDEEDQTAIFASVLKTLAAIGLKKLRKVI
jgi:hypothetical protein